MEGDGGSTGEEPANAEALGSNWETLVNCVAGIRVISYKNRMWLIAQLKCLYTNECSMGNKQGKLVAAAQMENYILMLLQKVGEMSHKSGGLWLTAIK